MTDQLWTQKAKTVKKTEVNNWMSSCREPATITFGPSQDHPILPLGISLKKLIILLKR